MFTWSGSTLLMPTYFAIQQVTRSTFGVFVPPGKQHHRIEIAVASSLGDLEALAPRSTWKEELTWDQLVSGHMRQDTLLAAVEQSIGETFIRSVERAGLEVEITTSEDPELRRRFKKKGALLLLLRRRLLG